MILLLFFLEAGAYHKVKNEKDQTPLELAKISEKTKNIKPYCAVVRGLKKDRLKETKGYFK